MSARTPDQSLCAIFAQLLIPKCIGANRGCDTPAIGHMRLDHPRRDSARQAAREIKCCQDRSTAVATRLIVAMVLVAAAGCINVPLRKNTVGEARTVADLYQQEVLNNLAMFAHDPNSVPYFLWANQGSSGVNDSGSVELTPTWSRFAAAVPLLFTNLPADLTAQRQAMVSFTLTPVNDPRRLELMRCAYQKAIASCTGMPASTVCPDCQSRFKSFYTGSPDGDIGATAKGIVTSECLGGPCWLGIGCKKDIPKGCPCQQVGEYCGVYVWALPGQSNELAKLTLAILDYANSAFPTEAQKSVAYFIDSRGLPTTRDSAVGMVSANIGVSEHNESLLSIPRGNEVALRDQLQQEMDEVSSQIDAAQKSNRVTTLTPLLAQKQLIQSQLNFLDQQLKVGGLRQSFIGGPAAGSAGSPGAIGILELNQQLNTLTPQGR